MQKPNRVLAFLSYLLPVVGSLLVLLINRKNALALYHACQALALFLGMVVVPVGWLIFGWLLAQIPLVGPILAAGLFALVIAAAMAATIAFVLGMINALRARFIPIPLFGGWGDSAFKQLYRP